MSSPRRSFMALPLVSVLGICSAPNGLQADMPATAESQQVLQQRLDALGKHFRGGSLARWSNPEEQKALQGMWDPSLLGQPPYSEKDVSALVTMLKAQVSVLRLYTGAGHAAPGTPKETRVRTKYQDEIVRSSAFLVANAAALLQAIGDFAEKLKPGQLDAARRKSIDEGRSGVRDLLESFDVQLKLHDMSPANRALLLDTLAANAETIAAYSPEADRRSYAKAADAALAGLSGADKTKLQAFVAAMSTKTCKGLCTIKG